MVTKFIEKLAPDIPSDEFAESMICLLESLKDESNEDVATIISEAQRFTFTKSKVFFDAFKKFKDTRCLQNYLEEINELVEMIDPLPVIKVFSEEKRKVFYQTHSTKPKLQSGECLFYIDSNARVISEFSNGELSPIVISVIPDRFGYLCENMFHIGFIITEEYSNAVIACKVPITQITVIDHAFDNDIETKFRLQYTEESI